MSDRTPTSDWKRFRRVRETALERLCERALQDLVETASDRSRKNHDRYLDVYKTIHEYDEHIAAAFNHLSRSKMIMQLVRMKSLNLVDESEFDQFSKEIRDTVEMYLRHE